MLTGGEDCIYEVMKKEHPKQFRCAVQIGALVENKYEIRLPAEEITYLCVHIVRITTTDKKN